MSEREDQKHLPAKEDLPGSRVVDDKFRDREWILVYRKNGLQKNNGYQKSEWYEYDILDKSDKVIGEYHIHPDRNKWCGYASGNLRLKCKGSFGSAVIGSARSWQDLCEWVCVDVDKYHGYGQYHRG